MFVDQDFKNVLKVQKLCFKKRIINTDHYCLEKQSQKCLYYVDFYSFKMTTDVFFPKSRNEGSISTNYHVLRWLHFAI